MARIGLVVTGDMERSALSDSLRAVFPSGEFTIVRQVNGFTGGSSLQAPRSAPSARSDVETFARTLLAALDAPPRRRDPRLDYVIGIDDLELMNDAHPEVAVNHLTDELRRQVGELDRPDQAKKFDHLRDRCSFHIFKPMPEAYFFGEEDALVRAGKLGGKSSRFDPVACDVEQFLVEDADYLRPRDVSPSRVPGESHWRRPNRERHPKQYLMFLSDPLEPPEDPIEASDQGRTWHYKETREGAAALRQLAWRQVLRDPKHAQFARSLFADIAAMLDVPPPFPGDCHTLTWACRREQLLRNL
ncbi:MAG TPA: hypothetical protein VLS89_12345 [Candidatus Nanopelagicales bacterium]|nr:hypothetical protein [Candidatus Nanopelagicales bacterium]